MMILQEKEEINNNLMELMDRFKIYQIVRHLNNLTVSRIYQISKFSKSIFKIKMVNQFRMVHPQGHKEVKEFKLINNKRDQPQLDSLKMVNLKFNSNSNN